MSNVLRALRRAAILCTLLLLPAASFAGFFISNGKLVDNNGTPFVMRGINYPYNWYSWRGDTVVQQDFANIAATGSNVVRVVLATGGQWTRNTGAQVTQIIEWCKALKMVAVLEVHDSTGWSESTAAVPISNATAYWLSSDIRAAINGQENYVIINIANEPFGNTTTANYVQDTQTAIRALRSGGLTHTLMIDGATWGQDWSGTMRDNATTLWNTDTLHNLVFSVHMYEVYQSVTPISAYMQAFQTMNLPLVVGEFGPINNGQFVDSDSVIAQAQARGIGYMGWSWSGNGGGGTGLDMTVNFDPAQLTTWGNRLENGTNGIKATSVLASVFGGTTNNLTVSPTTMSLAASASSATATVTANVSWTVSDDQSWISTSATSGSNNGSFSVSATANTGAARSGTVTVTGGGITRTIAVSQAAGTTNTLTVSTSSLSLASAISSGTFSVTSNVSWTVTDDQSWITVSPTSGSNNATITVNATSANTGTAARTGTVTVTGGGITRTVSVTQAGTTASSLTVSATSLSLASAISSGTFSVTSNVSWTVTDDQSWITVSPTSGSNNATVTVNATSANTATTSRTGTVTVTGGGITRTVSVTQAGSGGGTGTTCANPVTFSGNTGNFNTTGAACYRTNATVNGWGCYNFDGRTLTVSGVARTCGQMPLTKAADGYYYFAVTAGQYPWAGLYTW
jgi:mannan endo-1,4-beta-mannosidase